ncbi:MAG: hypothetical protein V4485_01780 [Pseudomonadota bacterium]
MQSYREKTPQIISVLYRKLKPGKTFEDFQEAHLPPGKPHKTEFGYDVEYFNAPTRVINAVSLTDPNMVISIGLTYGDFDEVMQEVASKKLLEAERHEKISQVADKVSMEVYLTGADNNYGKRDAKYAQLPLDKVTPELIEKLHSLLSKTK